MKVFEIFGQEENKKLDFDLHDDLMFFMDNDPQFYRTKYFPFLSKFKEYTKSGKTVTPKAFRKIVIRAYEDYQKKFNVKELNSTLSEDEVDAIAEKLHAQTNERYHKELDKKQEKKNSLFQEGGWDTTATQGTVITPQIVQSALKVIQKFVEDFNRWLQDRGYPPVEMGRPTGSSSYHAQDIKDDPTKIYGDIDLQMIGAPVEGLNYTKFVGHWNKLVDDFIKQTNPDYILQVESKPGHPIVKIGKDQYVQVDFMWHEEKLRHWGAARATPERGIKGLLMGNLFSVTGELLDMSIQHAGVQLKVIDDQHVPFSKQKDTKVVTISINPKTFIYDIFKYEYQQIFKRPVDKNTQIDNLLREFSGIDINNVKIAHMVNAIKGLARSFEINNMYTEGDLAEYNSAEDFLSKFVTRYEQKAMNDINSKKREKAETPEAKARAEEDRKKILSGLEMVKGLFAS